MTGKAIQLGFLIGVLSLSPAPALGGLGDPGSQGSRQETAADDSKPQRKKRPRISLGKPVKKRGSPVRSVGGGSRGLTGDWPFLYVLAPAEVGWTTQAQPSLFWYLSEPTSRSFLFTLSSLEEIPETVLEVKLKELDGQGISRMDLSALAIKLKPAVNYMWTISLEVDPESPSKNITSSTIIQREPASEAELQFLTDLGLSRSTPLPVVEPANSEEWLDVEKGLELAQVYAGSGYFLDALTILSNLVEAHPADLELQELRHDLLEQTDLNLPSR